jgi:protein TonB
VAYRSDLKTRDRGLAIAAVVAIHVALLFAFLNLSGKLDLGDPQRALSVFSLKEVPPPVPRQRERPQPRNKSGGSAPKNIKSQATPVAAPKPQVQTPPVPQIAASQTPRNGAAPTQGASNVAGPGTGAGGSGNGTGIGGGNGSGAGDGGIIEPPHLATPVLTGRDFPRQLLEQWPGRTTVFARLRIDAQGSVSECTIDRGTGDPSIDGEVCSLAHERLRFRPALNRSGQAVAGWFGYAQPAPR